MKIITLIMAIMIFTGSAFASCAISGGSCAYTIMTPPLQERYLPNNLQNIQKTDAFRPEFVVPYRDALINTETGAASEVDKPDNYNSNCQFGVCMPGVNSGAGNVSE